jgi:lysophospholipase L1-like esterase
MIMGDSIAVGIHAQAPRCAMLAHKGWTSARWHQRYRTIRVDADRVVISLGSNDGHGDTASQIAAIRAQVDARHVVWIIPACNRRAARAVMVEAARHGDAMLRIPALSGDGVHPTPRGYRVLEQFSRVRGGGDTKRSVLPSPALQ